MKPRDNNTKLRQILELAKKYTDETAKRIEAQIPVIKPPEPPKEISTDDLVAEVLAKLPKPEQPTEQGVAEDTVRKLIADAVKDIRVEYIKTGDTIHIHEAPQKIVERLREVVRTESKAEPVDYELVKKLIADAMPALMPQRVVGINSIRLLTDVDLTGVSQDTQGNYKLGEAGETSTFETVSKNLKGYPYTLGYVGGVLTTITYTTAAGAIIKTLNYTSGVLTSIVLSGSTPSGVSLTKTLSYTGTNLTGASYS